MTPKNFFFFFFIFFILTQKVLIRLLLYLTSKLLLNRRYMWTKMSPVWLLKPLPPPPPPGPHIATDIKHICKTYYPLFFLVVHMYPVWWDLHDTLVPLDSTYASPRPPKMKTKIWKKCSSDYFHILHIVELWCDFKMFVGPWSIYIYI